MQDAAENYGLEYNAENTLFNGKVFYHIVTI